MVKRINLKKLLKFRPGDVEIVFDERTERKRKNYAASARREHAKRKAVKLKRLEDYQSAKPKWRPYGQFGKGRPMDGIACGWEHVLGAMVPGKWAGSEQIAKACPTLSAATFSAELSRMKKKGFLRFARRGDHPSSRRAGYWYMLSERGEEERERVLERIRGRMRARGGAPGKQ